MLEASEEAVRIGQDRSRTSLLAVMKAIEIVGEAASRMSAEGRAALPQIPWADIVGMRNRLIHAYFDVDPAIVWKTVDSALPGLIRDLRTFLSPRA
jgi:uncharacterized protein with HEPN domain